MELRRLLVIFGAMPVVAGIAVMLSGRMTSAGAVGEGKVLKRALNLPEGK